jgi:PKD domain-containing protein
MPQDSLDPRRTPPHRRMAAALLSVLCTAVSIGATTAASAADASGGRSAPSANASQTTTTVPGVPRYFNYPSPPGTAESAGEPSIGSNWKSEQLFRNSNGPIPNGGAANYFGGFLPYMVEVTFNDCQSPAKAIWDKHLLLTANTTRVYGDPILFTDHATGRTFVTQEEGLTPLGSTTDITDNDGDSFSPSQGSGAPSCVDHETMGGGPYHAPLFSPPPPLYPNATYYASQCISDAVIALSTDGGVTFGPSVPMFTVADCDGLHGHIKVGPDGTVYVPDKACASLNVPLLNGGEAAVVVSEDNGTTWSIRTVPGATTKGEWDASVGVANDGTIYLGYQLETGRPGIAVSHDKGLHWVNTTDLGAITGIENCAFPAVVAGDGGTTTGRAAFAFYGSTTAGASENATFPGVWYLYIATTFDGGATWTTQNVTPGDPIQRGGICGSGTCRNMLDFFDATIDKEGRVLVGWDDGCINGCVNGPPNSFTAKAVITRQAGGKRMFAAYDPVEPGMPQAPELSGTLANGTVHLSWMAPDNGGADVTSYKLYRSINGAAFTLLATLTTSHYTDTVNPTDNNHYRLTAVNAMGEGPYCQEYAPEIPVPTRCLVPGPVAVSDVNSTGGDLDGGQNIPPDPSVDIRDLSIAEPYAGPGVNQLVFTLQLKPGGTLTPDCQWYIIWNRKVPAADASDRRFVAMKTDPTGAPSFVYGDFGPPLPIGSPPPVNANTPTPLGPADFGSFDVASGVMTIKLATSKVDESLLAAGDILNALNVRTFFIRPDAGQKSQNNAADITDNSSYTLVGNGSCFCTVDQPPVAGLTASPTSGAVPLDVTFNASTSFDPDAGDGVASYTFTFADGTNPVTQASPILTHTYQVASGSSGFLATVTVNDQKCGQPSLNIGSVSVNVSGTTAVTPEKPSGRLGIFPMSNPSHGQTSFSLFMDRDGMVNVQVFGLDGRRIANLISAWMPAGRHSLEWDGLDLSGNRAPASFYVVRARSDSRSVATRIVLLP